MRSNLLYAVYPSIVGILLGILQTGLFFQLSFTLSSSFGTFLMITLCWLLGSAIGVSFATRLPLYTGVFVIFSLGCYFACALLVGAMPFNTQLWPVYAIFITFVGLYPGVFFARMGNVYSARILFFRENNGFILGLIGGTLLFLLFGRMVLWLMPLILGVVVFAIPEPDRRNLLPRPASDEYPLEPSINIPQGETV